MKDGDDSRTFDIFDTLERNVREGRRRRDIGMQTAEGNERTEWSAHYRRLAERFLAETERGARFIGEDLRLYAMERGLQRPHHHNCWGAASGPVLTAWKQQHLIVNDGTRSAAIAKAHARKYPAYRKL